MGSLTSLTSLPTRTSGDLLVENFLRTLCSRDLPITPFQRSLHSLLVLSYRSFFGVFLSESSFYLSSGTSTITNTTEKSFRKRLTLGGEVIGNIDITITVRVSRRMWDRVPIYILSMDYSVSCPKGRNISNQVYSSLHYFYLGLKKVQSHQRFSTTMTKEFFRCFPVTRVCSWHY